MTKPTSEMLQSEILETWARCGGVEFVVAWNKLYRRELFFTPEHIRYPVGRLHEDEFTTYRLFYAAKSVIFVNAPLYHYVQRGSSITANLGERNLCDFAESIRGYIPWAEKYASGKRKVMEYMTMRNILGIVILNYENQHFKHGQEICGSLRKHVEKYVRNYMRNPYASWKDKVKYLLFSLGVFETAMQCVKLLNACKKVKSGL